jgi:nicotinate-nucleotide adenylyltransferase
MIAQAVLNQVPLGINRIYFIPAGNPPHRNHETDLAPATQRLEMVHRATLSNPAFWVLENEIWKQSASYTVETIEKLLKQGLVQLPVPMIIGSDALANLGTWHRAEDLAQQVCFLQMPRPGTQFVTNITVNGKNIPVNTQAINMPMLSLSSSWVREFIRQGQDNDSGLRYFVPEGVREYIRDNRLYR